MNMFEISHLWDLPGWLLNYCWRVVTSTLVAPGSEFSIASLLANLFVVLVFIAVRQRKSRTGVRLRALGRAIFPRRMYASASSRADVVLMLFNLFAFGLLFGWMLVSTRGVGTATTGTLAMVFGTMPQAPLSVALALAIDTVCLFVAFEFGYWLNHYLSHRVPLLWEFHKVHHTAEVLTPVTLFRVHPLYVVFYFNILAVCMGVTEGCLSWALGRPPQPLSLFNTNVLLLAGMYAVGHLQHSQVWLPFTGWLGKILISPAHHQIHHSTDPKHFDSNFGGTLAIFDWLAGTLYIPAKQREALSFGIAPREATDHTVWGTLLLPVIKAAEVVKEAAVGLGGTRAQVPSTNDGPVLR